MKSYSFLSLALLSSLTSPAQPTKPNILFVMTDQQSFNMLSSAGNSGLSTPAMDKLASKGYHFTKTYCTNPVSLPSRFALLTGHYGSEIGVRHNQAIPDKEKLKSIVDQSAMGKLFRTGGYETMYGGKIHLPMATIQGTVKNRMDVNYGFDYYCEDDAMILAKQSAEILLSRRKEDKPLLLFVSLMNPHDVNFFWHESILSGSEKPKNLSQREWETSKALAESQKAMTDKEYKKQLPSFPENHEPVNDPPHMDSYQKFTDKDRLNYYSWAYHRLTEMVDKELNVILDALEKSEIAENTIVVFTSDHGDMNGAHQLIMKNRFYEESARVPFIFAGKGILAGVADNETLVNNGTDLIPTLCDFAGISVPESLTGISLKPKLTGKGKIQKREYVFIENTVGYMVMDGRYKYAMYDGPANNELLTDIKNDPLETTNLAYKQSSEAIKNKLSKKLNEWMQTRNLQLDPTITRLPKEVKKK